MSRRSFYAFSLLFTLTLFLLLLFFLFFFFNDTATTEIYTLSLHDALPIYPDGDHDDDDGHELHEHTQPHELLRGLRRARSEEHTSELQSLRHLVCRLLLEKKKKNKKTRNKKTKKQNNRTTE